MSNLKILLKNNLLVFLGAVQNKKKRTSFAIAFSFLVLAVLGILALYTFQAYSMFKGLGALGLNDVCVFHGFTTSLSTLIIIGVMRIAGAKKSSDEELLLAMPIKKRDIVFSKMLNKYVFDLFFAFLLVMPYVVLYQFFEGFSIWVLLCGLLCTFLLPLLSVGLTYICDFLVSKVFSKSKYAGLLKAGFAVLIFIVVLGLMLIKTFNYGTLNPSELGAYYGDRPITSQFFYFTLNQNFVSFIVVALVCILPFVIGTILYSLNFGKSHVGYYSKNTNLKFKAHKSAFVSMFNKELLFYSTTPAFVVNTIIGPIMAIAFSIIFATMGKGGIEALLGVSVSGNMLSAVLTLLLCAFMALTCISCCTISLEGKNFWITKSSPVSLKDLFLSKIMLNVFVCVPALVIASITLGISLMPSFLEFLMILVVPMVFVCVQSVLGLLINLAFPKMEWDDETRVVKQGFSTLLTMLVGIVFVAIPVGLYFLFSISILWIALITLITYILFGCLFVVLLKYKGKKMLDRI